MPDIEKFFEPITNILLLILDEEDISQYSLFIHSSLHMASKYLTKKGDLPMIESWEEIIMRIISSPAYQSPPYLDKDAIKLAYHLFNYFPPEVNANLLLLVATHSINGAAFRTTSMSFMYLKLGLTSEEIWPMIEQEQYNLVAGLFFRTFTLSEEDLSGINVSLYNFISSTQVGFFDFSTPRNGAMVTFLAAVKIQMDLYNYTTLAQCAVQIVLCELESFRESGDIGKAYGALQFGAIALQKADESFARENAQLIYETAESMLDVDSYVFMAGFFQFIGLIAEADFFTDVEILFKCFDAIISYSSESEDNFDSNQEQNGYDNYFEYPERDLVQYFASYAAGNILKNIKKDANKPIEDGNAWYDIRCEINNLDLIKPLLSNVLRICKLYSTNLSTVTIRYFTDFFIEDIAPVATEYLSELFSIFLQYASEPHQYAGISISNCRNYIPIICRVISEQRPDVPPSFFSEALEKVEEVSMECHPEMLEDVLDLMARFINHITEISDAFIRVPQVLLSVIERDDIDTWMDESDMDLVGDPNSPIKVKSDNSGNANELHPSFFIKVIRALLNINPEIVISTPDMFLPIIEIVKYFLVQPESDPHGCGNSATLFQLIFIKLKGFSSLNEFAPMFLQMIDDINPDFVPDVVAALVYYNPVLTLQNEANFERWMDSYPLAFLMGALSVIQCWEELPKQFLLLKDQIVKKIEENLAYVNNNIENLSQNLNLHDDECDDSTDIFDLPAIMEAFSQISF